MKDYYCNSCYVGAGYGGKCHLKLPEIAEKPKSCPVFINENNCNWMEM